VPSSHAMLRGVSGASQAHLASKLKEKPSLQSAESSRGVKRSGLHVEGRGSHGSAVEPVLVVPLPPAPALVSPPDPEVVTVALVEETVVAPPLLVVASHASGASGSMQRPSSHTRSPGQSRRQAVHMASGNGAHPVASPTAAIPSNSTAARAHEILGNSRLLEFCMKEVRPSPLGRRLEMQHISFGEARVRGQLENILARLDGPRAEATRSWVDI